MTLHKLLELSESQRSFSGFTGEEINVSSYPKLESFHGSLGMGMWVREMSQLCFSPGLALLGMAGLQHGLPAKEGAFVMALSPGREARGMQGAEQIWRDPPTRASREQSSKTEIRKALGAPGLSSNLWELVSKQGDPQTKNEINV